MNDRDRSDLADAWGERRACEAALASLLPALRHMERGDHDAARVSMVRAWNRLVRRCQEAEDRVDACGFDIGNGRLTTRRRKRRPVQGRDG